MLSWVACTVMVRALKSAVATLQFHFFFLGGQSTIVWLTIHWQSLLVSPLPQAVASGGCYFAMLPYAAGRRHVHITASYHSKWILLSKQVYYRLVTFPSSSIWRNHGPGPERSYIMSLTGLLLFMKSSNKKLKCPIMMFWPSQCSGNSAPSWKKLVISFPQKLIQIYDNMFVTFDCTAESK